MQCTIFTHYGPTVNGEIVDGQLRGGVFYPRGEGQLATTLDVDPVGRLRFDPDTGRPIPNELARWDGDACSVQVLERAGGNGTRCLLVVWISSADVDGTVHTAEFHPTPGEGFGFGFVSIAID